MKEIDNSLVLILNKLYDKFNITDFDTPEINLDEVKNTLKEIIQGLKSNNIYQQRMAKTLKAKEKSLRDLEKENEILKKELKNYLMNRIKILHTGAQGIDSIISVDDGTELLLLKKKIDQWIKEEYKVEIGDEINNKSLKDYKPFKIKEVTNGN